MMIARMALRSQKCSKDASGGKVEISGPAADWPIWVRVSFGEPGYGGSEEGLTRRTAVLRTGAADLKAATSAAGPLLGLRVHTLWL